jgi:hypothetical protein
VWLLSLPLAGAGWLTAHWLGYAFGAPGPGHQEPMLSDAGHHYLGAEPVFVAFAITLLLAGIALAIHDGVRRTPPARVPVWPIALISPLGFAVQEHLECLIGMHSIPAGAALEPSFLVGMALQLPFAVAAVLLARTLVALGHSLGHRLAVARVPRPPAWFAPPLLPAWLEPELARPSILATGHGERAPPRPAVT